MLICMTVDHFIKDISNIKVNLMKIRPIEHIYRCKEEIDRPRSILSTFTKE